MAIEKDKIKSDYPFPVYNYRVRIGSNEMAFSEVSGLSMDYEKVIYRHGFTYMTGLNIIRAQPKEVNITLKRGISKGHDELLDWIKSNKRKDLTIDLCDAGGVPQVSWKALKAIPVKLEAPGFTASANEIAIEQMHLVASELQITFNG